MAGEQLSIDWASAEVEDSTLTVGLDGDAPADLRKRFAAIASLIDLKSGAWGAIKVRKRSITVRDVQDGAEDDLRHVLESVVLQLNSDLGQGPDGSADGEDGESSDEPPGASADRRMGERFRAFGQPPS
jgi:hypothetical protein